MKKNIWVFLTVLLVGYSGGVITGVMVDEDQIYNTTVKKIRQKRSTGDIVIDVDPPAKSSLSKKELREKKKEERKQERKERRKEKKLNNQP